MMIGKSEEKSGLINDVSVYVPENNNEEDINENTKFKHSETNSNDVDRNTKFNFWNIEYYQPWFDIDIQILMNRIVGSFNIFKTNDYFNKNIKIKPDIYGPVWIIFTVVFVINMSYSIQGKNITAFQVVNKTTEKKSMDNLNSIMSLDVFNSFMFGLMILYGYSFIIPIFIWCILRYYKDSTFSLLQIICLYGYSISSNIIVSLLWPIPNSVFRWILMIFSCLFSGIVLFNTFWRNLLLAKQTRFLLSLLVIICHIGLSLLLKFYYILQDNKVELPVTEQK